MQLDEDNSIPTSGQRDKGKGRADAGTDEDEEDDEEDLDQCAVNGATTVKEGTKNTRFIKWRSKCRLLRSLPAETDPWFRFVSSRLVRSRSTLLKGQVRNRCLEA